MAARGARSPEAPTEPSSGTAGVMSALRRSMMVWATMGRTPE